MRKKKHPEHVNHERWLVSYADFITLLFAFFVVMFAVSQVDSKKLGRAIYNLLLNACQAAKRGQGPAAVTLTLIESERSIQIRIADNGPGVPVLVRQKIFLPFVSESRESGTGLGLTLAQQIAQEHGGGIELEETTAGNTVFTINLPRAALQALGVAVEKKTSVAHIPVHEKG